MEYSLMWRGGCTSARYSLGKDSTEWRNGGRETSRSRCGRLKGVHEPARVERRVGERDHGDQAEAAVRDRHPGPTGGRSRGTRAVPGIQFKLEVGAADDVAEREADRAAESVVRLLRRETDGVTSEGDVVPASNTRIRRRAVGTPDAAIGPGGGQVGVELEGKIRSRTGGAPLDRDTREKLEGAFGVGFSGVRIHRDSEIAPQLGATAFTLGSDIHFAPGRYDPGSESGQRLLSHELTHVVQQGAAPTRVHRKDSSQSRGSTDQQAAPARRGDEGGARIRRRSPPAVQRLVGFEVELSVPTISNVAGPALNPGPGGAVPHPDIAKFFGGGIGYGTQIGQLATPFGQIDLTTDHNVLQRRARALYNALQAIASQAAGLMLAPAGGYVNLSNLEYSTPALDEMAAGSNARFAALANAIDNHAQQILGALPANQMSVIPQSNPATTTGVPVAHLDAWLGLPLPPAIAPLLNLLRQDVHWSMYVQATVGVLPTGLARMYADRAAAAPAPGQPGVPAGSWQAAKHDAGNAIVNGVNQLFANPAFQGQVAAYPGGDREAFKGLLMVGLAYTIGNAVNQTNLLRATMKNAVPLLVKMADIGAAATAAKTNWLRANPPPPALIGNIATWFHANVPQTNVNHWTAAPYNAAVVPVAGQRGPLHGAGAVPVTDTTQLLTRLLTGAGGVTTVGPGVALPATDPLPAAIAAVNPSGAQTGLPVEYRWISSRPNAAGQLLAVVQQVLLETRTANLTHVDPVQAAAISATW